MQQQYSVIITENDHGFITQEEAVFANSPMRLTLGAMHSDEALVEGCAQADGLLVQYAKIHAGIMPHLKRCVILSRYGVGYDTIDLAAATREGILVCNVPDYGTEEVSLQAIAMLMHFYRRATVCDAAIRQGVWDYRVAEPVYKAPATTVGVLGTGRIGTAFAQKAHALGFKVLACDLDRSKIPACAEVVDQQSLLARSDFVSLHCDLNAATRHMMNDAAFAAMKPTAVLINTARGGIVDAEALARALTQGQIAGAGLDVLEQEPIEKDSPLLSLPNVLLTPHIAWYSVDSRIALKHKTALNVVMALQGKLPPYVVNPEVLNSPKLRFKAV